MSSVTPFYLSCLIFYYCCWDNFGTSVSSILCSPSSEFQLSTSSISTNTFTFILFHQIFLTVGVNLLTHWHYIFAAFYCGFCKELLVLLSKSSPSGDMPWDRFELMLIQRSWAINTIDTNLLLLWECHWGNAFLPGHQFLNCNGKIMFVTANNINFRLISTVFFLKKKNIWSIL